MDLSYFESTIPATKHMINIIIALGWALLIGNLVFQCLKSMATGLGFEGEEPKELFLRSFVMAFFMAFSRQLCDLGLSVAKRVIDLLRMPDYVEVPTIDESLFNVSGDASWLLAIIVAIILIVQIIKLFFEIGERYVLVGVLTLLSPLAFSMGGSKSTADIFKGWVRMFASMCLMMVLSVVFLKLLLSAMEDVPSGTDILPWLIFVVALAKVGRKIDSIIARIGLNPAITGDPLGHSRLPGILTAMAVRSISKNFSGGSASSSKESSSATTSAGSSASGTTAGTPKRPPISASSSASKAADKDKSASSTHMPEKESGARPPTPTSPPIDTAKHSSETKPVTPASDKAKSVSPPKAPTAKMGTEAARPTAPKAASAATAAGSSMVGSKVAGSKAGASTTAKTGSATAGKTTSSDSKSATHSSKTAISASSIKPTGTTAKASESKGIETRPTAGRMADTPTVTPVKSIDGSGSATSISSAPSYSSTSSSTISASKHTAVKPSPSTDGGIKSGGKADGSNKHESRPTASPPTKGGDTSLHNANTTQVSVKSGAGSASSPASKELKPARLPSSVPKASGVKTVNADAPNKTRPPTNSAVTSAKPESSSAVSTEKSKTVSTETSKYHGSSTVEKNSSIAKSSTHEGKGDTSRPPAKPNASGQSHTKSINSTYPQTASSTKTPSNATENVSNPSSTDSTSKPSVSANASPIKSSPTYRTDEKTKAVDTAKSKAMTRPENGKEG